MGEGAKLPIVAFLLPVEVGGTKLRFVLVRVIELFHSVVSLVTHLPIGAFLVMIDVPALLRLIETQRAPPVLLIVVIVGALLQVVPLWI